MKSTRILRAFLMTAVIWASIVAAAVWAKDKPSVLRISQPSDVGTWDPALARTTEEANILEQIFEGLTVYDPKDCSAAPGVARKWDISKDFLTYTFYLRSDARWSDGSKVVALDFVYAWKRELEPQTGSPWANQLFNIKNAKEYYERKISDFSKVGITAVGDEVLKVELIKPQPYFLGWLSNSTMLPVKKANVEGVDREWATPGKLISNGAFVLASHEVKNRAVIKRNPFYWDAGGVKLDEVHYLPVEDENTAFNMYETGMLDVDGALPVSKIPILRERKDFHTSNYLGVYFYRYNTAREPFNKLPVRQAFNLAVDKKIIIDKILKGDQKVATNLVPEGISWYRPLKGEGYDPAKGRKLLQDAGYCVKGVNVGTCTPFPKIEILFNTLGSQKAIAEAMQSMLKENLGLDNVEIVNRDFKTVQAQARKGDFQLMKGGWIGDYVDPTSFLDLWTKESPNNLTGWSDPLYDGIMMKAQKTTALAERARLYNSAEEILNNNIPFMPIYFFVRLYLKKDYVQGYYDNILDKHQVRFVYLTK